MWDCLGVAEGRAGAGNRDFFISYTQADRAWAEWIAWVLEDGGYTVLIQAWDFVAGGNWVQGMRAGISGAERTIAVLSPDYLTSAYGTAEWEAAWAGDPLGEKRKLLTVQVRQCDRPDLLGLIVGADVFGVSEAEAAARLRAMVSAAVTGRAKPATAPPFPGGARVMPQGPRFPGDLPRVWKVPARNPRFTGRGSELEALRQALVTGSRVTVQAVRGMGGVGKTQLAVEYAHSHAAGYDLVWWIATEETATIAGQFSALAGDLGLEPATDPDGLRAQVHRRLRTVPGWLLIFDNADDAEDLRPWLPDGPQAAGIPGHVIVTTRRGGFSVVGGVLDLDVISAAEAVALLRTRVPDLDLDTGLELAAELGCLPLGLEQAAAYLDRTAVPPADYLRRLREPAAGLYRRGQVSGRPDTMATLWDLSLDRVSSENPAARQLLDLCAYLAPDRIPVDLFADHPDQLPEPLASAVGDGQTLDEAIGILTDYSLLKRVGQMLQIHRLLQHALAAHPATQPQPSQNLAPASQVHNPAHSLAAVLALLRADAPEGIASEPRAWPRWAVLLPHVLVATSHLEQLAAEDAPWLDASWLLDRAAAYLAVHAQFSEARALADPATPRSPLT